MAISEDDLDLLERYIDDEIDGSEYAPLSERLKNEVEFYDAFKALQAERNQRAALWQAIEPDQNEAWNLTWRVRQAVQKQQTKPAAIWNQWRIASVGSAAAACLVLGFFIGRAGHSGSVVSDGSTSGIVSNHGTSSLVELKQDEPVSGQSQFVAVNHAPQISVPITNEYGQVVAWQNFDNSEQAKNFTEELHRAHGESAPAASNGATKLVDQEQVPF